MSEKKYLRTVIGIAEHGDKRLRVLLYQQALFATVSIILLSLLANYAGLMSSHHYYISAGFFVGFVTARISSVYKFRYIYKHIDVVGLKKRLDQLNA